MICKYFLSFHELLFHSVGSALWCTKFLILMKSNLSIFSFVVSTFGVISIIHCQMSWSFTLMFSKKGFMVLALMFRFDPLWIHFCLWYKVRVNFCSFACGCSDFPGPFVEETLHSPLCSPGSLFDSFDHISEGLFLGSLLYSIGLPLCW